MMAGPGDPTVMYPTTAPVGAGGIPMNSYPVQAVAPMQGSSGGLVNKSAQIIGGTQAGINSANQEQQMQRSAQEWKEQQAGQAAGGAEADYTTKMAAQLAGVPAPQAAQHQSFMDSIMNSGPGHAVMAGVHAIGSYVNKLTGKGALPAPPAAPAPAAQGAPAAPAPASGPAPVASVAGGPPQVAQSQQHGGVVHTPEFMHPLPTQPQPTIVGLERGGPVPDELHMHNTRAMGVVSGGVRGIQGFAEGGAIPAGSPPPVGAQIDQGAAQGQDSAIQAQAAQRATTQFNQDQSARSAAGAEADYRAQIVDLHRDWDAHSLDDKGQPKNARGINNPQDTPAQLAAANALPHPPVDMGGSPAAPAPQPTGAPPAQGAQSPPPAVTPNPATQAPTANAQPGGAVSPTQAAATATEVQKVANNPAAAQGVPETPPSAGQPHSLTSEQWGDWDVKIEQAAAAAARAGHDPAAVRDALYASRNAFVQGHLLRNLSAANVALQNGDSKGVETALKNANYYLPNGQDLTVQKDASGKLVYQDPISPYLSSTGAPTYVAKDPASGKDNQPNMIPVDAAHLQQLGQAFLDPMNVQDSILKTRSNLAAAQLSAQRGQALVTSAQGRNLAGQGVLLRAENQGKLIPSEQYRNIAAGDHSEAQRGYLNWRQQTTAQAFPKIDAGLAKQSDLAASAVDDMVMGPKQTVPLQIKDPKSGQMVDNPSPQAGKLANDTSRADPDLAKASAPEIEGVKATAQDIYISNGGQMPPAAAASWALQLYKQGKQTHTEVGADGKSRTVRNVKVDRDNGTMYVYSPETKKWGTIRLSQYGAGRIATAGIAAPNFDDQAAQSGAGGIPSEGSDSADVQAAFSPDEDNGSP